MSTDRVISVIIVNYNGGHLLTDCVRQVLSSTATVSLYLIDNASTDDSLIHLQQTLGHDNRLHLLRNAENLGFAKAANLALQQATGDYLLFLNPDCLITKETLTGFLEVMDQHPKAGMAGCLVCNPDGTEQPGSRRFVPTPWRTLVRVFHLDKLFPNHPRFQNFVLTGHPLPAVPIEIEGISGACMFVRRSALEDVGPMDETYFLHCEDLDWFMRFAAKQWKILFIPTLKITHLKGFCSQQQPFRVLWYKHRGMVKFYRKFFRHQYPLPLFWGVIIAVWIRFALLTLLTVIDQVKRR